MSWEKEGFWSRSLDSLGMVSVRIERPQQISCYRSGDETGGLELMSHRRGVAPSSAHLLPSEGWSVLGLAGSTFLGWGLGLSHKYVGRRLEGEDL